MKTKSLTIACFVTTTLLVCSAPLVSASHIYYPKPGILDGFMSIGMSRGYVLTEIEKRPTTFHFIWNIIEKSKVARVNITEDEWDRENGDLLEVTDVLYVNSKIIQVQDSSENANLRNNIYNGDNLSDVIAKYKHLTLSSYDYDFRDPDGSPAGGYEGYYYDDERSGVAFYFGTQDSSAKQKIESIIIHRAGFPVIPPQHGAVVKRIKPSRELTLPFLYSHTR